MSGRALVSLALSLWCLAMCAYAWSALKHTVALDDTPPYHRFGPTVIRAIGMDGGYHQSH